MNAVKATLVLALLSGFLIMGGRAIGGEEGLTLGLLLAVGMNFFSFFFSDKLALRSARASELVKLRTRTSIGD